MYIKSIDRSSSVHFEFYISHYHYNSEVFIRREKMRFTCKIPNDNAVCLEQYGVRSIRIMRVKEMKLEIGEMRCT